MHHSKVDKNERLKKARLHAISHDGECLSEEYINANTKMKWKCNKCGNIWEATCKHIFHTSWCPRCVGRKPHHDILKELKEYALSKGGKCLSNKYVNSKTKLEWECEKKHNWFTASNSIISDNSWCRQCYNDNQKNPDGLKIAQEYALLQGGQCLSSEYLGAKNKLKWKCVNNHVWESEYRNTVTTETWCPQCSYYYYKEHKIRSLLEYLTNSKFKKIRPSWNINPQTNKKLELDGYCEELKIAFEFQGKHHYITTSFCPTNEELEYVKFKDEIKKQNCLKNGIKLIIIDDKFKLSDTDKILQYIIEIIETNDISYNKKYDIRKIKEIFSTHTNHQSLYLEKAKQHAISKGGLCLSSEYVNTTTNLKWRCKREHEWLSSYNHVVGSEKRWCRQCYLLDRKTKKD